MAKAESRLDFHKSAYNDMLGKGWDSGKQYSYCIQRAVDNDPQFWWVWDALHKFPHPPNWESVQRNSDGTYKSFPSGSTASLHDRIVKLACDMNKKGLVKSACRLLKMSQWKEKNPDAWKENPDAGKESGEVWENNFESYAVGYGGWNFGEDFFIFEQPWQELEVGPETTMVYRREPYLMGGNLTEQHGPHDQSCYCTNIPGKAKLDGSGELVEVNWELNEDDEIHMDMTLELREDLVDEDRQPLLGSKNQFKVMFEYEPLGAFDSLQEAKAFVEQEHARYVSGEWSSWDLSQVDKAKDEPLFLKNDENDENGSHEKDPTAPSVEDLNQMFKWEHLFKRLVRKGYHKEARKLRKVAQEYVADEWMRSNDPGSGWELIDGENDGTIFRYTYQSAKTGEIRTYAVTTANGAIVDARHEIVE